METLAKVLSELRQVLAVLPAHEERIAQLERRVDALETTEAAPEPQVVGPPASPVDNDSPLIARPVAWNAGVDFAPPNLGGWVPEVGDSYGDPLQHRLRVTRIFGRPIYSQMRHRASDGRLLTYSAGGYMLDGVRTVPRPRWVGPAVPGPDHLVGMGGDKIFYEVGARFTPPVQARAEASHEAGWGGRFAVVNGDEVVTVRGMESREPIQFSDPIASFEPPGEVQWAAISRLGMHLVVQTGNPSALLAWHINTRKLVPIWTGHARHCDLGMSSDGRDVVYVEGRPNPDLVEIDLYTGQERTLVTGLPWGRLNHISAQGPAGYVLCSANNARPDDRLAGMIWIASDQHPDRLIHLAYHHSSYRSYWRLPMATWSVVERWPGGEAGNVCIAWGSDFGQDREVGIGLEVQVPFMLIEEAFS